MANMAPMAMHISSIHQLNQQGGIKGNYLPKNEGNPLVYNTLTPFYSFSFFGLKLLILAYISTNFVPFLSFFHYLCKINEPIDNQWVSKRKQKK